MSEFGIVISIAFGEGSPKTPFFFASGKVAKSNLIAHVGAIRIYGCSAIKILIGF
jgi:hypothetical protein